MTTPAWIALISAGPTIILGWLGYKSQARGVGVSEQSGVVSGYSQLVVDLREDNKDLRDRVEQMDAQIEALTADSVRCQVEIRRLQTLMAANGFTTKGTP